METTLYSSKKELHKKTLVEKFLSVKNISDHHIRLIQIGLGKYLDYLQKNTEPDLDENGQDRWEVYFVELLSMWKEWDDFEWEMRYYKLPSEPIQETKSFLLNFLKKLENNEPTIQELVDFRWKFRSIFKEAYHKMVMDKIEELKKEKAKEKEEDFVV